MSAETEFKVLVVDDSPTVRQRLILTLRRAQLSEHIREATNGEEALQSLQEQIPDLVICDVVMPVMDGFGFLERMKQEPRFEGVPVIMLTGEDAVGKKVEAFERGAADYVTKPFDVRELLARCRVQKQLKELQDQLRKASVTDFLTGIHNRRHFMALLETEFERSRRYELELALIILDLDHFKQVNDSFGHPVGDKVLVELAKTMQQVIRTTDVVARFGGEEFALLMPHTPSGGALTTGERVRLSIKARIIPEVDQPVTVSLGLASFPDNPGIKTVEDLIREADNALYRAKKEGRDRLCVAGES